MLVLVTATGPRRMIPVESMSRTMTLYAFNIITFLVLWRRTTTKTQGDDDDDEYANQILSISVDDEEDDRRRRR